MASDLGTADAAAGTTTPTATDAPVDTSDPPGAPFGVPSPDRRRWDLSEWLPPERVRWLLPLTVVLFAAALRFAYLPHPERIYFDETYYATNAAQLLDYGVEAEPRVEGDPSQGVDPEFVVHPPVGKWLIAGGIAVFGDHSFGWRFSAAVAGTLLVAVTYFIALRLFRRRGVAALTAFLLSIEGLALTMSRIAMLDVFLALFVALGVWALVIDRDLRWSLVADVGLRLRAAHGHDGHDGHDRHDPDGDAAANDARGDGLGTHAATPADDSAPRTVPRMPRTYVWLAGLAFGLALATKWSALVAIGAAGLYLLASELSWRRALTGSPWRGLERLVGLGVAALVVVPAVVYLVSYTAWFGNFEHTRPGVEACEGQAVCDVGPSEIARGWYDEQRAIYRFHRDLEVTHDYRAAAILWPLTKRPVVYYYESCLDPEPGTSCDVPPGTLEEIFGLGNPAIWWSALAVYPLLFYAAVRRRDRVAATIAVFLLGQFLPWLGPGRPLFFFYALPVAPFVVMTLAWGATHLLGRRGVRWVPIGVASAALAAFVFWAPLYYGMRISESAWRMRIWMDSWI
jgi:dolichyl-phosphate-mannose-protein mannosyltransferase